MKYTKEDGRLVKSNWLMQKDEYKAKSVQYVIWIPNKGYYRTRALLTSNPLNATKFYNKQEAKILFQSQYILRTIQMANLN